jgi:hypothetical protein
MIKTRDTQTLGDGFHIINIYYQRIKKMDLVDKKRIISL